MGVYHERIFYRQQKSTKWTDHQNGLIFYKSTKWTDHPKGEITVHKVDGPPKQ